jgi:hypothetical protein
MFLKVLTSPDNTPRQMNVRHRRALTMTSGFRTRGLLVEALSSFLALVAMLPLLACNRTAPSADNPDGVDPPKENPHPTQIIKVRVVAPSSLKISLYESYYAPSYQGTAGLAGPGLCSRDRTKPVPSGHLKRVPVSLTREEGSYSGVFIVDRFLPGRCDWGFTGASTQLPGDSAVIYSTAPNPAYPHSAEQIADIWCGMDPAPSEPHKTVCSDLSYFAKYSDRVPPSLIAANPSTNGELSSNILFVDPTTTSVILRYHDLDAQERAAATSTRSIASPSP